MRCCRIRTLCGYDVDDLFTYDAVKTVRIRDARLGLLQYAMMFFIAVYIVVFQLLEGNSYLKYRDPMVNVRMTLQQPTLNNCNPNYKECLDEFTPLEQLPYCCAAGCSSKGDGACLCPWRNFTNFECQYVDGAGGAQAQPDHIIVDTFRHTYTQERNSSCDSTGCSKLWVGQNATMRFMADIEEFTLLVDHSVQNEELGISRTSREMSGWLFVNGTSTRQQQLCRNASGAMTQPMFGEKTTQAPCYIRPNTTAGGDDQAGSDFFTVRTLMMAMGLALDADSYPGSNHSLRYEGLTMTMEISYFNTWPWHGVLWADGQPKISYVYNLVPLPKNPYKVTEVIYLQYPNRRIKQDIHGIYLSVVPLGRLGVFDLQTLLLTLTTSLTLLAIGSTVVKYLAMYILKQRTYYKEMLIQVSADMSDVRDLEELPPEQLEEAMRQKGLPLVGSRVQRILALLDAADPGSGSPAEPQVAAPGQARLLQSESQMRAR